MPARFEELDWRRTALGELVLRRRRDPVADTDVYEIKLDDEFLMSSLFTVAEEELGHRGLSALTETWTAETALDVAVGGLGLGYTALAALRNPNVRSVVVVEALYEVIEWHERGLIPAGATLTSDTRCRLVHGDFFAMLRSDTGLDPAAAHRRFHAVLLDIDHSPRHLLHPDHAGFYSPAGLQHLARHLHPGGIFALWSNDPPDDEFTAALGHAFTNQQAEIITFHNPFQQREATATIYRATKPPTGSRPE